MVCGLTWWDWTVDYTAKNVLTWYGSVAKQFCYWQNWISTAVASGQYQISTHVPVSDLYKKAYLRAVFVELIQRCRTDIYRSDLLFSIRPVLIQNVGFCCAYYGTCILYTSLVGSAYTYTETVGMKWKQIWSILATGKLMVHAAHAMWHSDIAVILWLHVVGCKLLWSDSQQYNSIAITLYHSRWAWVINHACNLTQATSS